MTIPSLHPDVEIVRVTPRKFLVLNRAAGTRFEAGAEDRFLLELMDGKHSLEEVREEFERRFGRQLAQRHLRDFLNQLRREGLVATPEATFAPREEAVANPRPPPDPLSDSDPGGRLNHTFDLLALGLGWLLHPVSILPIAGLGAVAAAALGHNYHIFFTELLLVARESTVPFLFVAVAVKVLFVDLPRALLLGTACRRFGGRVRSFRFRLYRGVLPTFVCDIGDSVALMSRRETWTVVTVSLWSQLAIGCLAGILWWMSEPTTSIRVFFLALTLVAFIGLIVRMNVFAQTDGYSILVWLVEVPRLYERARAETRAWLTLQPSPEALADHERFWLRAYGLISIVLNSLGQALIIGLVAFLLTDKLHGLGAALSVGLCLAWYRQAIWRTLMKYSAFRWIVRGGGKPWVRWTVRVFLLAAVLALGFIPYAYEIGGTCKLVPVAEYGVRAQIADEIVDIHVSDGDWVEANTLIATLSGREARSAYDTTALDLKAAEAQLALLRAGSREEELRIAEQRLEMAKIDYAFSRTELNRSRDLFSAGAIDQSDLDLAQKKFDLAELMVQTAGESLTRVQEGSREETIAAAEAQVERLKAQLEYYRGQLELTKITTPIAGHVAAAHLDKHRGVVAARGELIALVQDTSALRVEIAADEAAASNVRPGMDVKVRLEGLYGRLIRGRVSRVALTTSPDAEFDVLAVRSDREAHLEESMEVLDSSRRVRVFADLVDAEGLRPGMTGYARVMIGDGFLWQALARPVVRFFRTDVWSWLP